MIWGKTYKELNENITSCKRWFAWRPVRLKDGQYAWWQYIWAKQWEHWGRHGTDCYFVGPPE